MKGSAVVAADKPHRLKERLMTPTKAYPKMDLTGQVFDSWTVLSFDRYSGTSPMWLCRCVCKEVQSLKRFDLLRSAYKSCGCLDIRRGWIVDGIGYIPLTQSQVTKVSPHRVEELEKRRWCAVLLNGKYYAYRGGPRDKGKCISIHMARQILGMDRADKREPDHINLDPLDNRDENLRIATKYQNMQNKAVRCDSGTGVKGVRFHKPSGMYQARTRYHGVEIHLGLRRTIEDAQKLYAEAIAKLHGEFARAV
jgi:hypothetical protein